MDMNAEVKPNSNKYKAELVKKDQTNSDVPKKINKVVSGGVKTKKKNKFITRFLKQDLRTLTSSVVDDVLIPAGKKVIQEAIDAILYPGGDGRSSSRRADKVSYGRYYERNRREEPRRTQYNTYNYDELIFDTRADAEVVLSQLEELVLSKYGVASVADLYDLAGVTGTFTDNNYGWMDLRSARIDRCRDGFTIVLPPAKPID